MQVFDSPAEQDLAVVRGREKTYRSVNYGEGDVTRDREEKVGKKKPREGFATTAALLQSLRLPSSFKLHNG